MQDKALLITGYILLGLFVVAIIIPMIYIIVASFMDPITLQNKGITFDFEKWTLTAYNRVMSNAQIWVGFKNAVIYSVVFTVVSVFITLLAAYPMSRADFKGKGIFNTIFVITMFFGGGLIPSYLVNTSLGLKNNFLVYIIPGAFSCYNLILIMNFFKSIPKALEEAALIDGASFFTVLWRIFLPLSKAGLATVALFIMVGNWNEWFTGILYMSDTKNYPLASFLQVIVVQGNQQDLALDPTSAAAMSERTIKAAQVFIGALPILLVYPFLQKYFVTGLVMGAVKE